MKLSTRQLRNLNCIFLYILGDKNKLYKNITISKFGDGYKINFVRIVSISELKKMNMYLHSKVKSKSLVYELIINNDELIIHLNQPELNQLTLFNDNVDLDKLKQYNQSITKRANIVKDLLLNTLIENDANNLEWVYFFKGSDYIGYANADINNSHCIKGNNECIPEGVYILKGNETDAKCILLRRNQNSIYGGFWKMSLNSINHVRQTLQIT